MGWKKKLDQMAFKFVLPNIGKMKLAEVRSFDIGSIVNQVQEQGYKPQTVLHVYNLMHKMFEDSVEYFEFLDKNPVIKRFRPKIPRRHRNFLSPEESLHLMRVSRNHHLGPAVWIGLLSGLRPSEIQALRWSAVDFEREVILIRAAYKRDLKRIADYPKQQDWGMSPMPPPLIDYLKEKHAGKTAWDFVAPAYMGGMLEQKKLHDGLKKLCRMAGVTEISPHELRHSCTELYVTEGATAEDLRRLLNHKSLTSTAAYIHRTEGRLGRIATQVATLLCEPLQVVK